MYWTSCCFLIFLKKTVPLLINLHKTEPGFLTEHLSSMVSVHPVRLDWTGMLQVISIKQRHPLWNGILPKVPYSSHPDDVPRGIEDLVIFPILGWLMSLSQDCVLFKLDTYYWGFFYLIILGFLNNIKCPKVLGVCIQDRQMDNWEINDNKWQTLCRRNMVWDTYSAKLSAERVVWT